MSTPNTPELVAIYQHIKAHPQEWEQRAFASKGDCGTAYCVAGWAVARAGGTAIDWTPNTYTHLRFSDYAEFAVMPDGEKVDIAERAAVLLGLDDADADWLFEAFNTLDDIRRIILDITGVDPELVEVPA